MAPQSARNSPYRAAFIRSASPRVELCRTGPAARSMSSATCSLRSARLGASADPSSVRAIAGSVQTACSDQSPLAGNVARSRPSAALPNAIDPSGIVKTWRQNGYRGLNASIAATSARSRACTGSASVSGAGTFAALVPDSGLGERMKTFDAARGIATLTTASARVAFVLIMSWMQSPDLCKREAEARNREIQRGIADSPATVPNCVRRR
jgi:hypothetical protein